jgi:cob(I)alamin adenosyltransferase
MSPEQKTRPVISTGFGDGGETQLFGGQHIPKTSPRIHAYGTIDELNAVLGLVLAEEGLPGALRDQIIAIQRFLFRVGADLAAPLEVRSSHVLRVAEGDVQSIEQWGVALEGALRPLHRFILPGGSRAGALLHLARTVCRRAERWVAALALAESLNPHVQVYLNRLSDYFFLAARAANSAGGIPETEV